VPLPIIGAATEQVTVAPSSWQAPSPGWIKVNVDAGWNSPFAVGGVCMIARSSSGAVLLSEWKALPPCASAEEAEILACLEGIRYLAANPHHQGILESDCARVVDVLSSVAQDRSTSWSLFLEAKAILNLLHEVRVQKVSRVSNSVAHDLAQLGKRECGVLYESVPPCALDSLIRDCKNVVT
jgi:ribonuclease HI